MKKWVVMALFIIMTAASSVAFASLDDTKETIAKQYGEYRMVIDTDNQLWTKADWDSKGNKKAKAASYMYSFERQGLRFQLDVLYDGDGPQAPIKIERFTPDSAIKVKEFKSYFPEILPLIMNPKAVQFASYKQVSRNFMELKSPVCMGVVIKELSAPNTGSYFTLLAFNIQDEGRLIKDIEFVNEDNYIREFTIERVSRTTVHDAMDATSPDWRTIKSIFH